MILTFIEKLMFFFLYLIRLIFSLIENHSNEVIRDFIMINVSVLKNIFVLAVLYHEIYLDTQSNLTYIHSFIGLLFFFYFLNRGGSRSPSIFYAFNGGVMDPNV